MGVFLQRAGLLGSAAAAPGGPTPADLFAGGAAGDWWDISDTTSLWQDTGATIQADTDGDAVARVDGQEGNLNRTQPTASLRPLYKISGGLPVLRYDGVDDEMEFPTTGLTAQALTAIGTAISTNDTQLILIGAAGDTSSFVFIGNDGSSLTGLHGDSGGARTLRADGVDQSPSTRDDVREIYVANSVILAQEIEFFSQFIDSNLLPWGYASGFAFGGDEYAYVFVEKVFSTSEQDDLEGWLADKRGITL